jgi:two-component system sensor kinase FixL
MNKLLRRQLEKFFGGVESAPPELALFLNAVADAYDGFDADRRLIERSLDISSGELTGINQKLRKEVNERRQMEAALRESEARFRQVAENAGEWIWEVDAEGLYTYANPVAESILGYRPEDIVGQKHFYDFFPPEDREDLKAKALAAFARKESFRNFINSNTHKDGRIVILQTSGTPILDPKGNVLGYRGVDTDITARKQAEEALRKSEAQLSNAMKIARLGSWEMDVESGMFTFTDSFYAIFHTTAQEMGGYQMSAAEYARRFVHPEDAPLVGLETRKALETDDPNFSRYLEHRMLYADGSVGHIAVRFFIVKDHRGKTVKTYGVNQDITERKRAEAELEALSARNEAILQTVPDIIAEVDRNKVYTWVNQAGREFFGDAVIGKEAAFYFEGEQDTYAHVQPLFNGGCDIFYVESWQRRHDGAKRLLAWWCRVRKDKDGNVTGALSTARDITECKQVEEALRKSEAELAGKTALLEAQLNSTIDGILVVDPQGRKILQNQRCIELWGLPDDIVANDDDQQQVEFVKNRAKDPAKFVERVVYLYNHPEEVSRDEVEFKDGTILDRYAAPVTGADGAYFGRIWLFHDITERKQVERKQAQLLEQLTAINQELKDFAHIVSHDLKAPLRAIRTLADWLTADYRDKLDEQGKENLRLLGSRVDRMQGLIDGVLQYSRVNHTEEDTTPVDLGQVVPDVVANLAAPPHISICVQADLPTVEANPTRITQVFQNLLSNAIKYMDKPEGNIRIDCKEEEGFWKFSVCDNGPGIEAKYFDKIFRLFQTLRARDEYESTGVGLAIVKKIVETYGGRVWVQSRIGEGSTFSFTLPKMHEDTAYEKSEAGVAC